MSKDTRLAIISDIHGNALALDVVLADIKKEGIEQIICLGDVASLGPQPREVITRLQELNCPTIMGNHDAYLLDDQLIQAYSSDPVLHQSTDWCRAQLSIDQLNYLKTFRPTLEFTLDRINTLRCFHGSPKSHTDMILATTPNAELAAMLGERTTLMIGGHTHIQMVRQYKETFVINPGSVGEPFDETPEPGNPPHLLVCAEYAIISVQNGITGIELRRLPFNASAMRQILAKTDLPLRGWLLAQYV